MEKGIGKPSVGADDLPQGHWLHHPLILRGVSLALSALFSSIAPATGGAEPRPCGQNHAPPQPTTPFINAAPCHGAPSRRALRIVAPLRSHCTHSPPRPPCQSSAPRTPFLSPLPFSLKQKREPAFAGSLFVQMGLPGMNQKNIPQARKPSTATTPVNSSTITR